MKLRNIIFLRLSVWLFVAISIWAAVFYFTMLDQVYDEVDDQLEDYAQTLIRRHLTGVEDVDSDASNNTYEIRVVRREDIDGRRFPQYQERMLYINSKHETEPARVMETVFLGNDDRWYYLTIWTPILETQDLRQAIIFWVVVLYVVLLILILIVNMIVYERSFRPLYRLLGWLKGYSLSEKNIEFSVKTRVSELEKLNRVVVDSLRRSQQMYDQQKMFLANASHEMQTPLAVVTNQLDMLLQTSLTEEQLKLVGNAQKTIRRGSLVNRTLLTMAKVQNGVYGKREKVRVDESVRSVLENLREVYSYKNIEFDTDIGVVVWNSNHTLVDILVMNLLKNAIVYANEGGLVGIKVGHGALMVSNSSERPGPLDESLIFQPFYKSDANTSSSGIGLALVRSVCDELKLRVRYFYKKNQHFFEISDSFQN